MSQYPSYHHRFLPDLSLSPPDSRLKIYSEVLLRSVSEHFFQLRDDL